MKYYCYRETLELVTESKDEVNQWIGEEWGCFEILDEDGNSIDEFIPF
jgi:hypothetical protein